MDLEIKKIENAIVCKVLLEDFTLTNFQNIKSELEKKGYKVDTGTINNIPNYTDALVTYVDKWMWDFGTYMYELTIFIKNPKTEYPIASGHSLHGSLTRLTPKEMVKEAVSNMLGGKSE